MGRAQRLIGAAAMVVVGGACTMIGSAELEREAVPSPRRSAPAGGPPAAGGPALNDVDRPVEPPSRGGNMTRYEQSGGTYRVLDSSEGYDERGIASWYGEPFHGRQTSSGEVFDMYELSAAHRTLPLPTWVRVTNLANGRSLYVRVNDRGPFHDPDRRIIDLSYAAALELGVVRTGTAAVRVEAVEPFQNRRR